MDYYMTDRRTELPPQGTVEVLAAHIREYLAIARLADEPCHEPTWDMVRTIDSEVCS